MNDTTDTATITASQRRQLFEELIGATKDHQLWLALDGVIVAGQDELEARLHREVETLARHFSGLEQAMLLVWQHVTRIDDVKPCGICEPGAVDAEEGT